MFENSIVHENTLNINGLDYNPDKKILAALVTHPYQLCLNRYHSRNQTIVQPCTVVPYQKLRILAEQQRMWGTKCKSSPSVLTLWVRTSQKLVAGRPMNFRWEQSAQVLFDLQE